MLALLFFLLPGYSSLTACAPAISKQFREQVTPPVSFSELLSDPNAYEGRKVILGGYILEVKNELDASLLTILQAPLDFQNRPHSRDRSRGRFLVRADKFMDPEIYKKDRKLTVGGRVAGDSEQPLGDHMYRYPVIEVEELYLWAEDKRQYQVPDPYWGYSLVSLLPFSTTLLFLVIAFSLRSFHIHQPPGHFLKLKSRFICAANFISSSFTFVICFSAGTLASNARSKSGAPESGALAACVFKDWILTLCWCKR